MIRVVSFLVLIALLALGAAWVADQSGDVVLTSGHWRLQTTLPVAALVLGIAVVTIMIGWSLLRGIWRTPKKVREKRRTKRQERARNAITHGLIAIGHGDATSARNHANAARKLAGDDPLALLLHAQSAQLDGDRDGASRAFRAMAERKDTRLLGLRGLFIEAQRADDPHAAVQIAEEALRTSPGVGWASQAVLGLRCAQGDWNGALQILERDAEGGLIDRKSFRRQRAVLLTARALDLETSDRDLSRDSVAEAVRLAPTLVPAAVLAAKFQSEAHQIRRAMRIVEAAWIAHPHPDLADAYAHVKLGDSARQRLVRVETLAAKAPDHLESRLALARAAIDAQEFVRAREALKSLIEMPTQRVAMLMAEIERGEHGDTGRARAWTQRAVRALHDPVWTADGYVSDRWRPVSPVTGRIDAFHWQTPLAALPSDRVVDAASFDDLSVRLAPPPVAPPVVADMPPVVADVAPVAPVEPAPAAEPEPSDPEPIVAEAKTPDAEEPAPSPIASQPLFRSRKDIAPAGAASRISPVIPIVRAPDDPGVDEDDKSARDEFDDAHAALQRQPGGWRGFLNRFGA
jgi:HemY protein